MSTGNVPLKSKYVRDLLGHTHCPACGRAMTIRPGTAEWAARPDTNRTRGHFHSVIKGKSRDGWIYLCRRCNHDQGPLSLDEWLLILRVREDKRADLVERLVRLLEKEGVL